MAQEIMMEEIKWFIAYDVVSENTKGLDAIQRDWLRSKRVSIWYELRYRFQCVPVQNSLWLIRDEKSKEELVRLKEEWKAQYDKAGFGKRTKIEIFPIATNEAGNITFKRWEFEFIMNWLGRIDRSLIKAQDVGHIGSKNLQAHTKKIELLEGILHEDFDDTYEDWNLAQDTLVLVWDNLNATRQFAV